MTPWRTPAAVGSHPWPPPALYQRPPPLGRRRPAAGAGRAEAQIAPSPERRSAVRRMRWDDIPTILHIAAGAPAPRWIREDFLHVFQSNETVGCVAVVRNRIAGFALCRIDRIPGLLGPHEATLFGKLLWWRRRGRRRVELFGLAVSSACPRTEVERALVEEILRDFGDSSDRIQAVVPESSVWAQTLLRDAGFRAIHVFRGYYGGEDGYLMRRDGAMPAA
jgi:ribosomal protein S18 acetylase RimI-like enzyme